VNALKIIVLLSFVIFVHECGHFFVAKWCKVKVKEFAIGFGPIIWQKQGKETKYTLRLIPLGGFVSMLGEGERSEEEGSFSQINVYKRILILLGGATLNILFGLLVYFILMSCRGNFVGTVIENVEEGYAAETVQLQEGDQIVRVDGRRVRFGRDINRIARNARERELELTIRRDSQTETVLITPTAQEQRVIRSGARSSRRRGKHTN